MASSTRRLSLFGEIVETAFDFGFDIPESESNPDLTFERTVGPRPVQWAGELVYHDAPTIEESIISLRTDGTSDVLSFSGVSDFRLTERDIECVADSKHSDYLVAIQFLGYVMAFWLERKGVLALHASAVATPEGAVAFLGPKGTGKSTIAASLVKRGFEFVTDDVLAVRLDESVPMVSASYPRLRMEPDALERVADGSADDFGLVHPSFLKRHLPLGALGGRMADRPTALSAVVVFDQSSDGGQAGSVTTLGSTESVRELLRHSFLAEMVQTAPFGRERLERLALLAETTRVVRVQSAPLEGDPGPGLEPVLEKLLVG